MTWGWGAEECLGHSEKKQQKCPVWVGEYSALLRLPTALQRASGSALTGFVKVPEGVGAQVRSLRSTRLERGFPFEWQKRASTAFCSLGRQVKQREVWTMGRAGKAGSRGEHCLYFTSTRVQFFSPHCTATNSKAASARDLERLLIPKRP